MSFEGVLKYADRGLYRAKKAGKNQAVGMVPSGDGANPVGGAESLSDSLQLSERDDSTTPSGIHEVLN